MALLTPRQQLDYQEYKRESAVTVIRDTTSQQVSDLVKCTQDLSQEQLDAAYSIFYDLNSQQCSTPDYGGIAKATDPQAAQILENRLRMLGAVLSPEQLQKYRQHQLDLIKRATMMSDMMKALHPALDGAAN